MAAARIQQFGEEVSSESEQCGRILLRCPNCNSRSRLATTCMIVGNVLECQGLAKPGGWLNRLQVHRAQRLRAAISMQGVAEEGNRMSINRSARMRWVSMIGLIMMLFSITPMGVAAQNGLTPTGDVAQAEPGPAIELLLVECPPDAPADPSDLIPGCDSALIGTNVNVTSVDPALGIDLPKTSVAQNPDGTGLGVINTGEIPVGEYRLAIDLPTDQNNFFFECRQRGTETEVPVTPSADGAANAFQVRNDGDVDIVCQAWVTPSGAQPTMEITYRECSRSDFPNENREITDLQANCTGIATDPPTFNVRDINVAEEPVTEHQLDAEGKLMLTLNPGNYQMFTDLGMDTYGEYLFCEYEGQPLYEKDFHPERGIVEFTNLLPGENFKCQWFGVSAADAPADAEQPTAEQTPTQEATQAPTAAPSPTEDAAADQPPADQAPAAVDDVTFNITYRDCTRGDFPDDTRTYQALVDNCTNFTSPGPAFTVLNNDQSQTNPALNGEGVLTFTHAPENFSIYTNLDPDSYGEYLFCSFDGGDVYEKPFPPGGINSFQDLNAGEAFNCQWFGVLASDTPTDEVPAPTATTAPAETSTFNIKMMACAAEDATWDTSSLDAFRTNCTVGNENVVMTVENDTARYTGATLPTGEATIADVPAGNWGLYSEIPGESATEYYFCSTDGGAYNAMTLSERGVASFSDVSGQEINCEIFVVPNNLRGDVTGASIEMHLSVCPPDYSGSSWYADCHANGTSDQQFTISGPNGDVTADAVVERTPGPAIARFTELPAGQYVIAGGPPQDFGTVFLYCSDPSTNAEIPNTFEGGKGTITVAENQSVVCDWYFVPENQGGPTPTPTTTPVPTKAEIFTTMFVCPPDVNVAGSTFGALDSACAQRLSDVPMTLQSPGGVPITANTGESGEGAIRFYELGNGDYVLTPKLPAEYVSAAVYCDLDGVNVYQKALSNGSTTFVNVEGEQISCSWFVTAKPQETTGPTGTITIREMLCEGDRSTITDWEKECQPASSGVSFTVTSSNGAVTQTLKPNAEGVAVFQGLPNDYYEVKQSDGAWCRAQAERVDSQSRVIVSNGGNTDVFLYQCNQEIGLPDTGTGSPATTPGVTSSETMVLGAAALPLFAIAAWQIRRWTSTPAAVEPVRVRESLTRTQDGYRYR